MTSESEMKLFDRWTETHDKAEFLALSKKLFPEATQEEMSDLFDKAHEGYREA